MSEVEHSDLPLDTLQQSQEGIEKLAESDLPVAAYAERALELLDKGNGDNR